LEKRLRRIESSVARYSKEATIQPVDAGFVLIDSSLRPIYVNAQAVRILSYPLNPQEAKSLDQVLATKMKYLTATAGFSSWFPFQREFVSGRRRYISRSFVVSSYANGSPNPHVALLLERASSQSVDISRICQEYRLTEREREVVEFLIRGLKGQEIAQRMRISPNTVKAFLRLVMIKMGVSTRSGIMGKLIHFKAA
jgi:DNA-binding CsgD family transcriptional regulator